MVHNLIIYYLLYVTLPILGVLFIAYFIIKHIILRFVFSDTQRYLQLNILYKTKRGFQTQKVIILLGYFVLSQTNHLWIICNKHILK